MKPIAIAVLLVLWCVGEGLSQSRLADLAGNHQLLVAQTLKADKNLTFRPETKAAKEYQVSFEEFFGKGFHPNYAVGDFNKDGHEDFAVLLARKGRPIYSAGNRVANSHSPDYQLTVFIFNGTKAGAFSKAFARKVAGPIAAFIRYDKNAGLYYGIGETDSDTIEFVPYGSKYTVRFAGL